MRLADKKHCCGCSACSTVCPFDAITMEKDEEGFIYPIVDEQQCRDCKKCENICPIINCNKVEVVTHNKLIVQGFFKEVEKHKASASGGAATAFSEYILRKNGCVFGSSYYEGYKRAKYIKVENLNELELLKGSKYIETEKNDIFRQVQEELNKNRIVLFTGLPCDVAGLKYYLCKDYENLYTCELICHGPTAQKIQEEYIEYLENKYKSKVIHFSSRYNVENIEAPYIRVQFENGKEFLKPLWDSEYGHAFAIYSRWSCYDCSFKGDHRVSDISIGDSWSVENNFGDKKGVSIMYAHTDRGVELIDGIRNDSGFEIQTLNYNHIKNDNPAIYKSLSERPERKVFARLLKTNGLIKSSFKSKGLKDKVKHIIKVIK